MNIATCVRKTASAALLTFLMGSAAACAADVSARRIVLSYVGDDFLEPYLRYPGASAEYGEEPGFVSEQLVEVVGALSVGLQRVGTADDKIAASALLGRAFLINGDRQRAGQYLDAALAGATAAGWDEKRANGILRDLAWLAGANGDAAAATDYSRRAETCLLPCAEDALPLFHDEAKAAMEAVFAALGPDLGATRIDMAEGEDSITFAEATFGPQSKELMGAWHSRAVAAADARPWQALDYYQQLLAIHVAAGKNDAQTLDIRRAVAGLLLKASEYRRLADFAAALIPDAVAAARSQPDILYLPGIATQAARLRARALWHLRDPGAQDAYAAAIDTMFEFGDADMARLLLQDLLDARYVEEVTRIADGLLQAYAGDGDALFAKARVAAWSGNFGEAAALVAQISEQSPVAVLQRAFYLEKAGETAKRRRCAQASSSRVPTPSPAGGPGPRCPSFSSRAMPGPMKAPRMRLRPISAWRSG